MGEDDFSLAPGRGVAGLWKGARERSVFVVLKARGVVFSALRSVALRVEEDVEGEADAFWGFAGDLKGVLNGERKGFESVCEAVSMRRRLAAGVDILAEIQFVSAVLM
jgi:hypothetical protein